MPDRTASLLARVAEFLRTLKPEELEALEAGEARLQVVFKTQRVAKPVALTLDVARIEADLKALPDRASALQYLRDRRLKRVELMELARQLNVPVATKETTVAILSKIVEQKVGFRADSDAIFARR